MAGYSNRRNATSPLRHLEWRRLGGAVSRGDEERKFDSRCYEYLSTGMPINNKLARHLEWHHEADAPHVTSSGDALAALYREGAENRNSILDTFFLHSMEKKHSN